MSAIAVLCSGQGFQNAGMFDLLADAPEAAPVFEAAKLVLDGKDPRQLVREASSEALHADKVGQILCCTQAMAAWAVVSAQGAAPAGGGGLQRRGARGLGCRGTYSIMRSVLDLAVQRAAAMDAATTQPSGLAAIRGLKRDTLDAICRAHGAYVAIVNGRRPDGGRRHQERHSLP